MKPDVTNLIADFVVEADTNLASRTEYQAEALRENACTDPASYGYWVDANDVKLLISAFALEDKDFAIRFPQWKHITAPEREKFLAELDAHFETCKHCSLKRGYDLEIDARIKKVCRQNSKIFLQLLREEDAESSKEGEHLRMNLEPAI